MTARTVPLGAILSITTGRLLADFGDVHELLDFMTGDTLFTHQLPRAMDEAAPRILEQHPDLSAVPVPDDFDGPEHVARWLAEQVAAFGAERPLSPLDPSDHAAIHPLTELAMMAPGKPVVVIGLDGEVPDAAH